MIAEQFLETIKSLKGDASATNLVRQHYEINLVIDIIQTPQMMTITFKDYSVLELCVITRTATCIEPKKVNRLPVFKVSQREQ
jgi:hypothetical protein